MSTTYIALAIAVLSIPASSVVAQAQTSKCAALAEAKRSTYGFRPSQLSAAEQGSKTVAMDRFWNLAKAAGPDGFACIRAMIAEEKTDKYFLFDAASLLVTFDTSGASDAAIVDALSRTDLDDVDPAGFIDVALQVSKRHADIGPAAHNYLNAPKVTAYLPRHAGYQIDRTRGAILLYGRMPADLVDKYLAAELASASGEARDTAAIVWSLNMTEASFKGLAALGDMSGFAEDAREQVRAVRRYARVAVTRPAKYSRAQILEKIAKWPEFPVDPKESDALDNAFYAMLTEADLSTVRDARRRLITGVSNEAIDAYSEASRMLMNLINVLDAYKQYRVH